MIHKKNIYGTKEIIYGSILLTNRGTGRKKYFLVCEIEDCPENRKEIHPKFFGVRNIRLASDFRITQKNASLMEAIPSDGLIPYEGYKF